MSHLSQLAKGFSEKLGSYANRISQKQAEKLPAFSSVKSQLQLVEKRINQAFSSEAPQLIEISNYLLSLGGKRVRPLLTLLAGRLLGMDPSADKLIDVASGIELIHMATLLHDDIIDEAPTRRHKPSAYLKYGLTPSLLTGDFLLVRAFGICAHLDNFIIEATEQACVELTEGELLEGKIKLTNSHSIEEYINIVGKKTASLFALSTTVGAHLAGADQTTVQLMRSFGFNAGVAFQIIDDILDIIADESLLGKPNGTDLRQQCPSVINILWLQSGDSRAITYFAKRNPTAEEVNEAILWLKQSSIITESRKLAQNYAKIACNDLSKVTHSIVDETTRENLVELIDYVLDRCM